MDAAKFIKEWKRMCRKYKRCAECPLSAIDEAKGLDCNELLKRCPAEFISVIEKWSGEHPVKTRQSELLKMFPNTRIIDGHVYICPKDVDTSLEDDIDCSGTCSDCKERYWNGELL